MANNLPGGPPVSPGGPAAAVPANPLVQTPTTTVPVNTAAINTNTAAIQQNTGAINENADATGRWTRLQEDQRKTFRDFLKEEVEGMRQAAAAAGDYRRYISEVTGAFSGMAAKMKEQTSLSTIYNNALGQLSEGTKSYTASLQANTGAIGDATQQSTAFVTGLQAAQAQSHELAARYNMDAGAIAKAGETATQMFATQLGAIGDVSGGIKSLQKESVIFSRFFGTDMTAVMQHWQERMEHSNMTLTEAKDETALLAKVADQYAISLGKLGDKMLQTAQLGKKEFLEMAKQINQEFRLGVPNVVAYTAAMAKMSLEAAKKGSTKIEQATTSQGLLKLMNEMTSTEGQWGVMAFNAAQKSWQQFNTAPETMSKEARSRLEGRRGQIEAASGSTVVQAGLITEAMKGTSDLAISALKSMKEKAGGDQVALTAMLRPIVGSMTAAADIAEGLNTGSIEEVFEKHKEALMGEAEKQKTATEKLVTAGAKTNSTLHSMAKDINSIYHWMIGMAVGSPVMTALSTVIGGAVMNKVLGSTIAALGPKILATAAPTALSTVAPAALSTGVSAAGGAAAIKTALAGGAAAAKATALAVAPAVLPTLLVAAAAYSGYKYLGAKDEAKKLSKGGRKVDTWDVLANQINNVLGGGGGWHAREFVSSMTFKELAAQKKKIAQMEKEIKDKETNGKALTEAEKQEIILKKRKLEAEKAKIAAIVAEEKKIKPFTDKELAERQLAVIKHVAGRVASGANVGGRGAMGSAMLGMAEDSASMAKELVGSLGLGVGSMDAGETLAGFLHGGSPEAAALMKKLQAKRISQESFESEVDDKLKRKQLEYAGVDTTGMNRMKMYEEWGKKITYGTSVTGLTPEIREAMSRGSEKRYGGTGITGVDPSSDLSEVRKNPDGSVDLVTTMKVTSKLSAAGAGIINAVGAWANSGGVAG
jgi:hypothetical protein